MSQQLFEETEETARFVHALTELRAGHITAKQAAERAPGEAQFFVPVSDLQKQENGGTRLTVVLFPMNGGNYIAAFSGNRHMEGLAGAQFVAMPFSKLGQMCLSVPDADGIIVNPITDCCQIPPSMYGGGSGTSLLALGIPESYPDGLISSLAQTAADTGIVSLRLAAGQRGAGMPFWIAVTETRPEADPEEISEAWRAVRMAAAPYTDGAETVCADISSEIGKTVVLRIPPVWTAEDGIAESVPEAVPGNPGGTEE